MSGNQRPKVFDPLPKFIARRLRRRSAPENLTEASFRDIFR